MIRLKDIWQEAWRNLTTGATKALIALTTFVLLVGGVGLIQVRALVDVSVAATQFEQSGAAIQIVSAPEKIDGAQCEAMASHPGISAAGALRTGPDARLAALPSTAIHTHEVTPGMAAVLGVTGYSDVLTQGVWLSDDLAAVIGGLTSVKELPLLEGGSIQTAGVYGYPPDGRLPALAYTMVSPVPTVGAFDACWMRIWPEDDTAFSLILLPWQPTGDSNDEQMPRPQQLNGTLGISFNAQRKIDAQPIWPLTFAGIGIGTVLGFTVVQVRRLELASALHAGLDKTSLTIQVVLETLVWVGLGSLLLASGLGIGASLGNPDPPWVAWYPGLRTAACAGVATLFGAIAAVVATHERHLFRYFKQR